jgi:hypothetical protein
MCDVRGREKRKKRGVEREKDREGGRERRRQRGGVYREFGRV